MCAGVSSDGANTQEITGIPALAMITNIDQLVGTDNESRRPEDLRIPGRRLHDALQECCGLPMAA